MEMAGRREHLQRDRLPAREVFGRYLDVGDPAHRRQADRALVPVLQPDAGAVTAWGGGEPGLRLLAERQGQL